MTNSTLFADVVAAYEVLGTPDKRAVFDEARNGAGGEDLFADDVF